MPDHLLAKLCTGIPSAPIAAIPEPDPEVNAVLDTVLEWEADRTGAACVRTGGRTTTVAGDHTGNFELASITKVLIATAVLVAVEEGSMTLDQQAGPQGSTIAHLLAHASGLGPDGQRLAPPGVRRIYSNAGFEVLGEVLASSTGMSCATYLGEAVLEPLQMTSTELIGSPASGARSTVDDLARLAREWLEPSRVLAPETVTEARRPWFGDLDGALPGFGSQRPNPWGLGVEIRGHKVPHWTGTNNSPATFGHFGQAGGFLWVDPIVGIAFIALTDRDFGPWATTAWPEISDRLLDAIGRARPLEHGGTTANAS